jgi:hypothetical protein
MNTVEQALDPGYTAGTSLETDGRDTILLRGLLQNPTFHARFLKRTAELLNTVLAADAVVAQIDGLAAVLEPNIAFESRRWQGENAVEEWRRNVEQLRDFARRRPDVVWQQMVESLGLPGTARLTLAAPGAGQGKVAIDGRIVSALPWQGTYFLGSQIQVTAVPAPGYRFVGWEAAAGTGDNPITVTIEGEQTLAPRFVAVNEDMPRPGDVVFDDLQTGEGGRLQLRVTRPEGVDLRGWRLTDNDSKTATDEGSLIFTHHPAFARVPSGTTILIVLAGTTNPNTPWPADDLDGDDRQLRLYPGNGHLDGGTDPWFRLGANDNVALLAPGETADFGDDRGIAFMAWGDTAVTPGTFGVLNDGIESSTTR